MAVCNVCFRHCDIPEGGLGFCGARSCKAGEVYAVNAGRLTALALDPIEKKPLARFYPGSRILSAGSFGCNLRCRFCQNHDISWYNELLSAIIRPHFLWAVALATLPWCLTAPP